MKVSKSLKTKKAAVIQVEITTYEEAVGMKEQFTEALTTARKELQDFVKKTGLKKAKNYSTDKTHGVAWVALNSKIEEAEAGRKKALAFMKENKPQKGTAGRASKHNYPDDVLNIKDSAEQSEAKKKWRTKTRSKAKSAGVSVDEYLTDPIKYDSQKADKKGKVEKAPKKGKVEKSDKAEEPVENNVPKKTAKKKAPLNEKPPAKAISKSKKVTKKPVAED
jgi:hypothetical protein